MKPTYVHRVGVQEIWQSGSFSSIGGNLTTELSIGAIIDRDVV